MRVESEENSTTLRLRGELDLATADIVRDALDVALKTGGGIVIDLRDLEFIDSTGIAILIGAITDGSGLVRFLPSQAAAVTRVLRITGVEQRMQLLD